MKLIKFIKRLFLKYQPPRNPFSKAIADGIREAFREKGNDNGGKENT